MVEVKERSLYMEKRFYEKVLCSSAIGGLAALAYVTLAGTATLSIAAQGKVDTAKIEQLTGAKAELNEKEGPPGYYGRSEDESGYGFDLICSVYESRR
jgi:hypothetical protein